MTRGQWSGGALLLATSLAAAACGRGDTAAGAAPVPVPVELVPAVFTIDGLTIVEDEGARESFTLVDEKALIHDGRLWVMRHGEDLVATLQVSTMKPDVDLTSETERAAIAGRIVPPTAQVLVVAGTEVWAASINEKTTYVWFAEDLFEVLQVKTTRFGHEVLLTEILIHQTASDRWRPLPIGRPGDGAEVDG